MYKHIVFERRPLEDIRKDIESASSLYGDVARTVFIGDSNSLVVGTDDVVAVLCLLYRLFPNIERVTSYARAKTLYKKPLEELKRLRAAGLTRLHVGLETGSRDLLKDIRKGATPDEFAAAGEKAKAAGFELSLYVLLGIGGQERWREHAGDTADVLNQINPDFIRVRTVQPQPGSLLYDDMKAGRFTKASHETVLREQALLVENLRVTSQYLSDHITNYVPVNGTLPEDRKSMLALIQENLDALKRDTGMRQRFSRKDRIKRL